MTIMDLPIYVVAFICGGVFLASFTDAIAGGGGIISVPVYLIAGIPTHLALGTNKLSSGIGTAVSTFRYAKNGYVDWKYVVPSVIIGITGASIGTRLQLIMDERFLKYLLLIVLPITAAVILKQKKFPEERIKVSKGKMASMWIAAFIISMYDGFYGPGAGTFLLLAFCNLGGLDIRTASGNMKFVNLSSNIGAVVTSFLAGKVIASLGLVVAIFSIAGHYVGSSLTMKNGSKIVRPVMIVVIILLAIKVVTELVI